MGKQLPTNVLAQKPSLKVPCDATTSDQSLKGNNMVYTRFYLSKSRPIQVNEGHLGGF